MIALVGDAAVVARATRVRAAVFRLVPLVLANPHTPMLSPECHDRVMAKLAWLANHEQRASFYCKLIVLEGLRPGTPDEPTSLPIPLRSWAYGNGANVINVAKPTAGQYCANGHVVRKHLSE